MINIYKEAFILDISSRKALRILASVAVSTALVESSKISTLGLRSRARCSATPAGTSVRPFRQALPIGLHHLTCVIRLPLTMNAVLAMSIIGWSNRLSV